MEQSSVMIEKLMEIAKKWQWANEDVAQVCEKAANHIQQLEQRIKDRDAWLKEAINIERELYKGSG